MPASRIKSWLNPQALLRNILGIKDSAHSIALGTAIGMAIGMSPTVGIQMIIVMLFAMVSRPFFHFNRMAGVLAVYISNPVTMVPIYYFLYWVGTFFVEGTVTRGDFENILEYEGFEGWWHTITGLFVDIGTPLIIGTAIVAPISGLITYPVMRVLLRWFRGPDDKPLEDESAIDARIQNADQSPNEVSETTATTRSSDAGIAPTTDQSN